MADIALVTANKVEVVESIEQMTLPAAEACVRAMEAMRSEPLSVQAIQDRFPDPAAVR